MRALKNITKIFSGHFEITSCHKDQVFFQATLLYLKKML